VTLRGADSFTPLGHMAALFAGRTDAYAVDRPEGGMRPIRTETEDRWLAGLEMHTLGSQPIGVYPLLDDGTVSWGCIDVDCHGDTPLDEALVSNIMRVMPLLGLVAWEEVSRSGGRHIWVFASPPVPAISMRQALLAVGQILEVTLDEVNPKQVSLTGEGLGNLVRIPYPGGHDRVPETQVVLDEDGCPMGMARFAGEALLNRNSPEAIERVSALYRPPVAPQRRQTDGTVTSNDRYMSAAIEGEFKELCTLHVGSRNHRLYQSALKLGRFVAQDPSVEERIIETLMVASRVNGLVDEDGEHSVLATIRSGVRNGAARGSSQ
jgi:hypothetical protein